jgi:hypothetical protein
VHHAAAVRVVQRARDLTRDANGVLDRQLLLAVQPVAQRLAFHVRHDVVNEAIDLARVVQRKNVRMLQVRRRADLCEEPFAAEYRGEFRAEQFQRDQPVVSDVAREEDQGHAAGAELALDAVLSLETG